jgi:LacI family transcriptional regulator
MRLQIDRDVMRGVFRYANTVAHWQMYPTPWDVDFLTQSPPPPKGCDGVIVRGKGSVDPSLTDAGTKVVVVTGAPSVHPRVWVHDVAVGRRVGEYLLARGYRHGVFVDTPWIASFAKRASGFRQAFVDAGRAVTMLEFPTTGASLRAEAELLDSALSAIPKPVAAAAPSADMARRLLMACEAAGLSVPQQVAVVACEYDELVSDACRPHLSGVDVRGETVGYMAAELLDSILRGNPSATGPVIVPPGTVITRQSSDASAITHPRVVEALAFIEAHATEPMSVKDIAARLGVHRRTLEFTFEREVGKGPGQILREYRLDRACRLLNESSLSVGEIASRCGYCHMTHFANHFREVYGCTPTEHRVRRGIAASDTTGGEPDRLRPSGARK